jgi:hypothetical protein
MTAIDGLYKVTFATQLGNGYGVVYLHDGEVHGGDSAMAYTGDFQISGDQFNANVKSAQHSHPPGMSSVFGVPAADITLKGTISGTTLTCQGTAKQAPGITFKATLVRIAD